MLDLAERVLALQQDFGAPGLAVALVDQGGTQIECAGVASLETRAPVSGNTLFQVGSLSKLYTALLVMQCVERGQVDLDTPMQQVLDDLRLGDPSAARAISVRHLLSHTSGLDGDFALFDDSGIAAYVRRLAEVGQLFAPGQGWSYSNSGYVLLGHLVEVLCGKTWANAVRQDVFDVVGLRGSVADPAQGGSHPLAVGHVPGPTGALMISPVKRLGLSLAPAGAVVCQSIEDLARTAQVLLDMACGDNRHGLLQAQTLTRMTKTQRTLKPNPLGATGWGLGVTLHADGVFGHDGATIGQRTSFRIDPSRRRAIAILSNGAPADRPGLHDAILDQAFGGSGKVVQAIPALAPVATAELARYVGTYQTVGLQITVRQERDTLLAELQPAGQNLPSSLRRLQPISRDRFASFAEPVGTRLDDLTFDLDPATGRATAVFSLMRSHPRSTS